MLFWSIVALAMIVWGMSLRPAHAETGTASWYKHGAVTASGEPFDKSAMTCAHRSLPFGTHLRVTVIGTDKSVVVRVNDRGPFLKGRIIDLSEGAAARLGMKRRGVARVHVERLTR